MQRNRMAVVFVCLAMVLFGAYVMVQRSGNEQLQPTDGKKLSSLDGSSATNPLSELDDSSFWSGLFSDGSESDQNNVTKIIARATFEQMKALDQQGKSPFDESNTNSLEIKNAVEESVSDSTNAFFKDASISNTDIKITTNNTKDAKKRYLSEFEAALARHPAKEEYKNVVGGLQGLLEQSCAGESVGISRSLSANYTETARDVMGIQVPSQWTEFHKQIIMYYLRGSIIFDAVAGCANDPIKGFTAAQALPDFVSDSAILQKLLEKMYTEAGS